jgi:hypothetical protein
MQEFRGGFAGNFPSTLLTKLQVNPRIVGQFSGHLLSALTEEKTFIVMQRVHSNRRARQNS